MLVHQDVANEDYKGGLFGYFVDEAVKGGGNLTVELLYKTLQRLRALRQSWPQELRLQLDNTCSDNKNKTVLGFLGWLVATGTFAKVTLSFLPVGHTHEDIDAVFGVIARRLRKIGAIGTLSKLMDIVFNCLQPEEGAKSSWKPSANMERIRATHDWGSWLKLCCEHATKLNLEQNRAKDTVPLRPFSHYALTTGDGLT